MYKFNHSPELTPKFLEQFNKECKLQFYDSSWHNDLVDSIGANNYHIQIWMPNSAEFNPDEELFNTFSILIGETQDEADLETDNINEAIKYLNDLKPSQLIAAKHGRPLTLVERINESQLHGTRVYYYAVAVKYNDDYFDDPERSLYSISEVGSIDPDNSIEKMQKYRNHSTVLAVMKLN